MRWAKTSWTYSTIRICLLFQISSFEYHLWRHECRRKITDADWTDGLGASGGAYIYTTLAPHTPIPRVLAPCCVKYSTILKTGAYITQRQFAYNNTVCPGSSDPFYIVSYYIKWVTTSWTHSIYMCRKLTQTRQFGEEWYFVPQK